MEKNCIEDLQLINKKEYINNMRKNETFGGSIEIQIYSIISKLKIVCFIRNLLEINEFKADDSDQINSYISDKKKNTNIYIILNVKK